MLQSRVQIQQLKTEGGTVLYNALGQSQFVPEPKFGKAKVGNTEVDTVSTMNPHTWQWETHILAPGGVGTGGPNQTASNPAKSPLGAFFDEAQANEAAQASR